MKIQNLTLLLALVVLVFTAGCKTKKRTGKIPKKEKKKAVSFSGSYFFTTDKVFRANSSGESMDQVTSKKKALTNARNEMAQSINTLVKTVTDNYTNSRTMNRKEELEQRFEELNREVVNQSLTGTR